jgi:BMFP domain-containing protein YqiC
MFGISRKEYAIACEHLAKFRQELDALAKRVEFYITQTGNDICNMRRTAIAERDTLQSRIDQLQYQMSEASLRINSQGKQMNELALKIHSPKRSREGLISSNLTLEVALSEAQRFKEYNQKLISKLSENRQARAQLARENSEQALAIKNLRDQNFRLLEANKYLRQMWIVQRESLKSRWQMLLNYQARVGELEAELKKLKGEDSKQPLQGS